MKNSMLKKGLVIGLLILFFGAGVFPIVSGSNIIEKNNQDIVNTQITNDYDNSSIRYVHKIYMLGRIYNLTYDEEENHYHFEYHNLRILEYYRYGIRYWGISYEHRGNVDGGYGIGGAIHFRGILRPTFICGVFVV
jgi:hypothetical protein